MSRSRDGTEVGGRERRERRGQKLGKNRKPDGRLTLYSDGSGSKLVKSRTLQH